MMVISTLYALATLIGAFLFAFLGGGVLGYVFFMALRINVKLYAAGRVLPAVALHVFRTAVAVVAFIGFAALGAVPLMIALASFLIARYVVSRPENHREPGPDDPVEVWLR